ncbi:hypothetical protein M0Q50_09590 [bacterium]|jgi:hypothetical protein|nr:hypothetical protein [bacterium]
MKKLVSESLNEYYKVKLPDYTSTGTDHDFDDEYSIKQNPDKLSINHDLQKNKFKSYVPRPGSCPDKMIKLLSDGKKYSSTQLFDLIKGFNGATVQSTMEFLVDKGIINKVRELNPLSNRMAYMYSINR